jgi:hypothetical protein
MVTKDRSKLPSCICIIVCMKMSMILYNNKTLEILLIRSLRRAMKFDLKPFLDISEHDI